MTTLPPRPTSGANWEEWGIALDAVVRETQAALADLLPDPDPDAPLSTTMAVQVFDAAVKVSLGDVPTATGYRVERNGTDNTGAGPWGTTILPGAPREITFDKLVNGTTYIFTVQPLPDGVVSSMTGVPSGTQPEPDPDPEPVPQVTVSAIAQDGAVLVSWTEVAGATGYLVGRNGVDSTGYGAWSTVDPPEARRRLFQNLVNGTGYTFTVQPQPTGSPVSISRTPTAAPVTETTVTGTAGNGTVTLNWVAVQSATGYRLGYTPAGGSASANIIVTGLTHTFSNLTNGVAHTFRVKPQPDSLNSAEKTITLTPTAQAARSLPLLGLSGLSWNSVVFGHGAIPTTFETWRRRRTDGAMVFPYRLTQSGLLDTPARRAGDILVWAIPAFVQGQGFNNAQVAAGTHDTFIKQMAAKQATAGWNTNRTIIRLNWEQNGNWYEWGWDRGGVSASIAAFRRFVDLYRANGMSNCLFSWNLNKGPQAYNAGYSWTTGYPGDQWTDIVGIDSYDAYTAQKTEAAWQANTVGKNPGLYDVLNFVKSRNKLMAIEEWGVCNIPEGGGDNPFYVGKIFDFCKTNAQWIAYEVTYDDDGAPSANRHKLSTGGNPLAAARYRQVWPNGWGG